MTPVPHCEHRRPPPHTGARIRNELRIRRRLATIAPGVWQRDGFAFGSPCVEGTTVPTEALASRFRAGDTIAALAADFHVTAEQVEAALRFEMVERCSRCVEFSDAEFDGLSVDQMMNAARADFEPGEDVPAPAKCFIRACREEPRVLGQFCAEHWAATPAPICAALSQCTVALARFALLELARSNVTSDDEESVDCYRRAEELRARAIWAGDGDPFVGLARLRR